MSKKICTKCFVTGLLLALICVFGLPFFSSVARAADDADIDMAAVAGIPADESTPEESVATETAPQGEDQRWIEFVSATLHSEAQRLHQVLQNAAEALRQGVQFGLPEGPGRRIAHLPAMPGPAPSP